MSGGGPNMTPVPPQAPSVNASPAPAPAPAPAQFKMLPGGMSRAMEIERRGPTLLAAQNFANETNEEAIHRVEQRSVAMAHAEYEQARTQAAQAYARQDAIVRSQAERAQDLADRQQDFDQTVKQLSQMRVDPDRFWASRSTAQKVSDLVSIALGGFLQGARGGSNPGMDIINQTIDRDIEAQKFAYAATRDTAAMKQTAFAQAMQKYQNEDAATAMARAAALNAVQAEVAQIGALQKGTEVGNRADMAMADLAAQRANQVAQGIAFLPSQPTGPTFLDPVSGIPLTRAEYLARVGKMQEQEFEREKKATDVAGQLMVEGAKNEGKTNDEAKDIAKQLQSAGVPQARAHAETARRALMKAPVSTAERFNIMGTAATPTLQKAFYGQDAAEREQAWLAFKNDALHTLSGAAISPTEMPRLERQFEGAHDTESRLAAIRDAQAALDLAERNAMAGASPAGQAQYRRNKAAAEEDSGAPKSLTYHEKK